MGRNKPLTKREVETELRRHTTKLRASMRGMSSLFRRRHAGMLPPEAFDEFDAILFDQLEQGIARLTASIREGRYDVS